MPDPNGFITTLSFDAHGNVISISDPQGSSSFVYTEAIPEPNTILLLGSMITAWLGFVIRRKETA